MRVTILTVGSRGDVQPFLALGRGLERVGYRVRVAAYPRFEPFVQRAGLEFAPLAEGRLSEGPSTAEGRRWLEADRGRLPAWSWVGFIRDARSVARRRLADALRACEDADAVIASHLAILVGWQMSERYEIPLIRARLNLPQSRPPPASSALRQAAWTAIRPWLSAVRRDVGLPAAPPREPLGDLDSRSVPVLYGVSPAVLVSGQAFPPFTNAVGFWFLDQQLDPEPPPGLEEFLAAGPAPVCIGFGSMLDADPAVTRHLAVAALARAGQRGVLIRGEYGLGGGSLPDDVFAVDTIAHDWLFPRCAAVAHHAATGTIAASLHAGVPSIPVPHMGDQNRWARRLTQLGVAARPIARRRLTEDRLYESIATVTADQALRSRAAAMGERIRAEDGVARGVEAVRRYFGPPSGVNEVRVHAGGERVND